MNPFGTFSDWLNAFFLLRGSTLCVAMFMCALACFSMASIWTHLRRKKLDERDCQHVALIVVAVHPESIKTKDNHVSFRSEYEIISGIYKGKRKISEMSSFPALHSKGETVPGLYNNKNGEIESLKAVGRLKLIPKILLALGLFFLCGALAIGLFFVRLN